MLCFYWTESEGRVRLQEVVDRLDSKRWWGIAEENAVIMGADVLNVEMIVVVYVLLYQLQHPLWLLLALPLFNFEGSLVLGDQRETSRLPSYCST